MAALEYCRKLRRSFSRQISPACKSRNIKTCSNFNKHLLYDCLRIRSSWPTNASHRRTYFTLHIIILSISFLQRMICKMKILGMMLYRRTSLLQLSTLYFCLLKLSVFVEVAPWMWRIFPHSISQLSPMEIARVLLSGQIATAFRHNINSLDEFTINVAHFGPRFRVWA